MSDTKQLPKRHEVEEAKTWDLTTIYESDEAWERDFEAIDDLKDKFVNFQGTLGDGADNFLAAFETLLDLNRKLSKLFVYSHLKSDQDTENSTYQTLNDRARLKYAEVAEARSCLRKNFYHSHKRRLISTLLKQKGCNLTNMRLKLF